MKNITATISVPFSDEDVADHIAYSGFTQYPWWADMSVVPNVGIKVKYQDREDMYKFWYATLMFDTIREIMGKIANGEFSNDGYGAPNVARRQIIDGFTSGDFDIDADGADEIMQCAVYDTVIFS